MAFKSVICSRRKQAVDWTGPLDKVNYREDNYRNRQQQGQLPSQRYQKEALADKLANEIQAKTVQVLKNIKVKGSNLYEWAHQLGKGLQGLASSTDMEVKRAYFQYRSLLNGLLEETDKNAVQEFYTKYGQNPQDWNFIKISRKTAAKEFFSAIQDIGYDLSSGSLAQNVDTDEDFLNLLSPKNSNKEGKQMKFRSRMASRHTANLVPVDVEMGGMRRRFQSELPADNRNAETDHVDDKFQKNYPTKQPVYETKREVQDKLEEPKKVQASFRSRLAARRKKADGIEGNEVEEPTGDINDTSAQAPEKESTGGDWVQKVLDYKAEEDNKELLEQLLEACSAVGVPEDQVDDVCDKVLQEQGMSLDDAPEDEDLVDFSGTADPETAKDMFGGEEEDKTADMNANTNAPSGAQAQQGNCPSCGQPITPGAPCACNTNPDQNNPDTGHVAAGEGLRAQMDYGEPGSAETTESSMVGGPRMDPEKESDTQWTGAAAEENQLTKAQSMLQEASNLIGANKDALVGDPGGDAHMEALDSMLETLAHLPAAKVPEESTIQNLQSIVDILMDMVGEYPEQLQAIQPAIKNCTQVLNILTSYRSSFGKASSEDDGEVKFADGGMEITGTDEPSGEDYISDIAEELATSDLVDNVVKEFEDAAGSYDGHEDIEALKQELREKLNNHDLLESAGFYSKGFTDEDFDAVMDKLYVVLGLSDIPDGENPESDIAGESKEPDLEGASHEPGLDEPHANEDRSFYQNPSSTQGI
jgi:hypothetical protein